MQLTDEPDKRCYPLEGHLLCRPCHVNRLRLLSMSTPQSMEVRNRKSAYNFFTQIFKCHNCFISLQGVAAAYHCINWVVKWSPVRRQLKRRGRKRTVSSFKALRVHKGVVSCYFYIPYTLTVKDNSSNVNIPIWLQWRQCKNLERLNWRVESRSRQLLLSKISSLSIDDCCAGSMAKFAVKALDEKYFILKYFMQPKQHSTHFYLDVVQTIVFFKEQWEKTLPSWYIVYLLSMGESRYCESLLFSRYIVCGEDNDSNYYLSGISSCMWYVGMCLKVANCIRWVDMLGITSLFFTVRITMGSDLLYFV